MKTYTIKELKDFKKELVNLIWKCDDFMVDAYFKGYEKFIDYINRLNNRKISDLDITEIRVINFINKLSIYNVEFMIKQL